MAPDYSLAWVECRAIRLSGFTSCHHAAAAEQGAVVVGTRREREDPGVALWREGRRKKIDILVINMPCRLHSSFIVCFIRPSTTASRRIRRTPRRPECRLSVPWTRSRALRVVDGRLSSQRHFFHSVWGGGIPLGVVARDMAKVGGGLSIDVPEEEEPSDEKLW